MPNTFMNGTGPYQQPLTPGYYQQQVTPSLYPSNGYFQPPVRNQVPQTIPGKIVSGPEAIMPGDVPMNGCVCLFPQQDWSCIWGKWWDSNGTLQTAKFVPETPKEPVTAAPNFTANDIMERLDKIEQMISGGGGGAVSGTSDQA